MTKTSDDIIQLLAARRNAIQHLADNLHENSLQDYPFLMSTVEELDRALTMIGDDRPMEVLMRTNYVTLDA